MDTGKRLGESKTSLSGRIGPDSGLVWSGLVDQPFYARMPNLPNLSLPRDIPLWPGATMATGHSGDNTTQ